MTEYRKIDTHSHIGGSYLGPESDLPTYLREANLLGVIASVIATGASPQIFNESTGLTYFPCIWQHTDDGQLEYTQQWHSTQGVEKIEQALQNPYHMTNEELFKMVERVAAPRLYVMPLHHPALDTPEEVKSMVTRKNTVALKIHGIASFSGPENISIHTIDVLRKADKPVVVHTDLYRGDELYPFHKSLNMNDPLKWVDWARDTGIKTLITHGARLSPQAIKLAVATENVMIGVSPDLLLMSEPLSLAEDTDDFLRSLFDMVPPDKLLFDIDYGYNVIDRESWNIQDWDMENRIKQAATKVGFTGTDLEKIFYNNATTFFNFT